MSKSAVFCGFGHIYWKSSKYKNFTFVWNVGDYILCWKGNVASVSLTYFSPKFHWSSTCIFTYNATLPQVFLKHFASKKQLPGFYISATLVENGLKIVWAILESLTDPTLQMLWSPLLPKRTNNVLWNSRDFTWMTSLQIFKLIWT